MSNAFPPHDDCPVPQIEAISDLDYSCLVYDPPFPCLGMPLPPPPFSFDFGCYPLTVHVDWDPDPADRPEFSAKVVYLNKDQTGYCRPQIRFRVRMGAAGCGNISVVVLADHDIELSGCQNIDGVDVCTDDRVLTIAQTDPLENDVWIVQSGAWIRYETALACNSVVVRFGNKHAKETWEIGNTTEPEHGTDIIQWIPTDIASMTCRLRLTDPAIALENTQTVDGVVTEDGDLVVVDTTTSGLPSSADGIWLVVTAGAWVQLFAVDPATAPVGVPVLPAGAIVTVWDGWSAPWLYVVARLTLDDGP
jgi:hypothetical protein